MLATFIKVPIVALMAFWAYSAHATPPDAPATQEEALSIVCTIEGLRGSDKQRYEYASTLLRTSRLFGISPSVMVAIKKVESGLSLGSEVSNHNSNGTVDRGLYQVNYAVWQPAAKELGLNLKEEDFHDMYTNSMLAGWVLGRQLERFDNDMMKAVSYYHKGGGVGASANRIRSRYMNKFLPKFREIASRCGS